MTHELKCWPDPFSAVWRGDKTAELRRDDRGFQVGDVLLIREYDTTAGGYTGRALRVCVSHITRCSNFAGPSDFVVLSLGRVNIREINRTPLP